LRALAAGDTGIEDDFVAGLEARDVRADFGDFAGNVAAGNVRERNFPAGDAFANPEIEMIERAGADAHQNIIRADSRFGDIFVAQDFRAAVFGEDDGFHLEWRT